MHLKTRNVNTGFKELLEVFTEQSINHDLVISKRPSRNGNVFMIDEPVTVTYTHPKERVLFNPARNANPFFHLYESLWMLAGRNDIAPLAYYNKKMLEFSDDGVTQNGAYGYRWRHHKLDFVTTEYDQLDVIVNHLKTDPTSRRAVLSMWNVEDDLLKIGKGGRAEFNQYMIDLGNSRDDFTDAQWNERFDEWNTASKDVCCNLSVMFSIREGRCDPSTGCVANGDCTKSPKCLDMTVTNRSNDLIWGMLGANYVHFTFLQEYMAARLGVEVGLYHHFTNNLHVYDWNWKPKEWLADCDGATAMPTIYHRPEANTFVPLVQSPAGFEYNLGAFVLYHNGTRKAGDLEDLWQEPFLSNVAGPMLTAFACHKEGSDHCALMALDKVAADDWRIAGQNWIKRRIKK